MRRPKRHEIGAGIAGAALGVAIGATVEGGVPEVVNANVPPDNGRNSGAAVGVEESKDAYLANKPGWLRRAQQSTNKTKDAISGGKPPDSESGDDYHDDTTTNDVRELRYQKEYDSRSLLNDTKTELEKYFDFDSKLGSGGKGSLRVSFDKVVGLSERGGLKVITQRELSSTKTASLSIYSITPDPETGTVSLSGGRCRVGMVEPYQSGHVIEILADYADAAHAECNAMYQKLQSMDSDEARKFDYERFRSEVLSYYAKATMDRISNEFPNVVITQCVE